MGGLLLFTPLGLAEPSPFHEDVAAVEAATLEASRAALLDDTGTARKALDRLKQLCRTLKPEDKAEFGEPIVNADQAYHLMLDRARESAGAGEAEQSFETFVGVQTICRTCHGFAKTAGRWPANETSTSPIEPNDP